MRHRCGSGGFGSDRERTMLNVPLARVLGLYQIVDPATVSCRGRNAYHVLAAALSAFGYVASAMLCANAAYYAADHGMESVLCSTIALNFVYVCWKVNVVVRRSGDMWRCLRVARFDFLSAGRRGHRALLQRWRRRSVAVTNALFFMMFSSMVVYVSCPLALGDTYATMTNRHDGSVDRYRLNVFNVYFVMPADGYNRWYYAFYLAETSALVVFCLFNQIFDTLLITLCLSISSQFHVVSAEVQSIGHDHMPRSHRPATDPSVEKILYSTHHDMVYDKLKATIMDHQAIMKKHKEFLKFFQWKILTQIIVSSISLIFLWFIVIESIIKTGMAEIRPTTIRLLTAMVPYIFQIFMTCYFVESINNQKESFIHALYSSNWTEMNLKCKKLILLTMKINNAHQQKIEFTKNRIVNLELFYKTAHFCFSILSVLLNYNEIKKQ